MNKTYQAEQPASDAFAGRIRRGDGTGPSAKFYTEFLADVAQ
ncbi:hypothetical protein [Propionivibrio sp.]|nr:hypothetical protein [Propionivibrio sp.]